MKAQSEHSTDHFRVSGNARDRIKLPGVFWADRSVGGESPGVFES